MDREFKPAARQIVLYDPRSQENCVRVIKIHSNLGGYVCHLLSYFHVRLADQPTVMGVAFGHKKVGDACYRLILQTNCVTLCSIRYFTRDFLYIMK